MRQEIAQIGAKAFSQNTRNTYRQRLDHFTRWLHDHGLDLGLHYVEELPAFREAATPEMIAAYIVDCHESGHSIATIQSFRSAVRFAHREANLPDPTDDRDVRRIMRGLAKIAPRTKQAQPLTPELLDRMEAEGCDPRDVALCRVLFEGMVRIGEAAALRWRDVSRAPDGSGRIYIARSKTDQEGEGATIVVTSRTYKLLRMIRQGAGRDDLVWGVTRECLRQRVKRAGKRVGAPNLSGHSGRVGGAQHLARQGAPLQTVMAFGRWESHDVAASYVRDLDRAEALRFFG